jgi:hypothetical protein
VRGGGMANIERHGVQFYVPVGSSTIPQVESLTLTHRWS